MDFRPYIKAKGWSLRSVWRRVGGQECHFHRVISGKVPISLDMAKKISAAVDGYLPVGFLLGIEPFAPPVQPSTPAKAAA